MSDCTFEYTGRKDGDLFIHKCTRVNCGREIKHPENPTTVRARCKAIDDGGPQRRRPSIHQMRAAAEIGLGQHMLMLMDELKVPKRAGCKCGLYAMQMNEWGPDGCRKNIRQIEDWMLEGYGSWKDVTNVVTAGYLTIEQLVEEAIRRTQIRPRYVNIDAIGWGDLAIFAYICEGTKNSDRPMRMCATGQKAEHIRMLGLEPYDPNQHPDEWSAFTAECKEGMVRSRLEMYAEWYAVPNTPKQPTLKYWPEVPDGLDERTILCFPDSLAANRRWPTLYWKMLCDELSARGFKPIVFPVRDFQAYGTYARDVKPLIRVVGYMLGAGMAIGIDSALMNWTPIADLPGIALLGPTRAPIFSHAPYIRCIHADENVMPCTGCCYHLKHQPWCDHVCMSLANLKVETVLKEALDYHGVLFPV